MSEVLFFGGPPLRPAPGCEGHRFHALGLRWSKHRSLRRVVGYWTVGRWYISGLDGAVSAAEGPEHCAYVGPLLEPGVASLFGPWPGAPSVVDKDDVVHWLRAQRPSEASMLFAGPQPAVFVHGLWSTLGVGEHFDGEAMRMAGWSYICPAKIGEVPVQHAPKKQFPGERHLFPAGDPTSLLLAAAVGAPSGRAGAANGADQ